jgi:pimeloyl-ACP methyl ester carboxylesterase
MGSERSVAFRAAQVGVGLLTASSGAAALMLHRRADSVRASERPDLDAALVAPEMHHRSFATSDGGVVHYIDSQPDAPAEVPVVVLLHGISLQWWIWAAVVRELMVDFRVIAWDMRGFGASRAGSQGVSIPAAAADLALLAERLQRTNMIVVGHSMGGMVLGRFAVAYPTAVGPGNPVGGLVFLDTTAKSLDGSLRSGGLVRLSKIANGAARLGISSKSVSWKDNDVSILLLRGGFGRTATKRMVDDMRRCQAEAPSRSMSEGSASIAHHDVLDALTSVSCPTAVVVGADDRLTPPMHAEKLHRAIAGSTLTVLPHEGHNVMQENPTAVADAVREVYARLVMVASNPKATR